VEVLEAESDSLPPSGVARRRAGVQAAHVALCLWGRCIRTHPRAVGWHPDPCVQSGIQARTPALAAHVYHVVERIEASATLRIWLVLGPRRPALAKKPVGRPGRDGEQHKPDWTQPPGAAGQAQRALAGRSGSVGGVGAPPVAHQGGVGAGTDPTRCGVDPVHAHAPGCSLALLLARCAWAVHPRPVARCPIAIVMMILPNRPGVSGRFHRLFFSCLHAPELPHATTLLDLAICNLQLWCQCEWALCTTTSFQLCYCMRCIRQVAVLGQQIMATM
jgi:hypothetical protein